MITLSDIEQKLYPLHPSRILNVYLFGSRVYQTGGSNSDWDLVVIAKTHYQEKEIISDNFNIHLLSQETFESDLKQNKIRSLECIMAPEFAKLKEVILYNPIDYLNTSSLRYSISHINSNSWVKCKKKLLQGDYYIGIKSLWHAIRIVMFGIQISKFGKIIDFSCANSIWFELISKAWTWEELDSKYRELNNSLLSEFRKNTPKS